MVSKKRQQARWTLRVALTAALVASASGSWAIVTGLDLVQLLQHPAFTSHSDQGFYLALITQGQRITAFVTAFRLGDKLFETELNALDGAGANVGHGLRFTHVPRADLKGPGEWMSHVPPRDTGPNATSCLSCHGRPARDGAGLIPSNVLRDPLRSGNVAKFIERNPPHLFCTGAIQRLAEEMTTELQKLRSEATAAACAEGRSSRDLTAKGVGFGRLAVTRTATGPCKVQVDTAEVQGVDEDLVVRPFRWKGNVASLRDFVRTAANSELGMQAVELVGAGVDGDFDGVVNELTVGDVTALTVYLAAQPSPTTSVELAGLGIIPPLLDAEKQSIARGD